jgi:DNA-binding GntR family transcriptional regulator
LQVLDLLEQGRNAEASEALRSHLSSTLKNLKKISGILKS